MNNAASHVLFVFLDALFVLNGGLFDLVDMLAIGAHVGLHSVSSSPRK